MLDLLLGETDGLVLDGRVPPVLARGTRRLALRLRRSRHRVSGVVRSARSQRLRPRRRGDRRPEADCAHPPHTESPRCSGHEDRPLSPRLRPCDVLARVYRADSRPRRTRRSSSTRRKTLSTDSSYAAHPTCVCTSCTSFATAAPLRGRGNGGASVPRSRAGTAQMPQRAPGRTSSGLGPAQCRDPPVRPRCGGLYASDVRGARRHPVRRPRRNPARRHRIVGRRSSTAT